MIEVEEFKEDEQFLEIINENIEIELEPVFLKKNYLELILEKIIFFLKNNNKKKYYVKKIINYYKKFDYVDQNNKCILIIACELLVFYPKKIIYPCKLHDFDKKNNNYIFKFDNLIIAAPADSNKTLNSAHVKILELKNFKKDIIALGEIIK